MPGAYATEKLYDGVLRTWRIYDIYGAGRGTPVPIFVVFDNVQPLNADEIKIKHTYYAIVVAVYFKRRSLKIAPAGRFWADRLKTETDLRAIILLNFQNIYREKLHAFIGETRERQYI